MYFSTTGAMRRRHVRSANSHLIFTFNRGVMATPIDTLTADGYDLQFGTNVLGPSPPFDLTVLAELLYCCRTIGHFLFTKLLLPTLISTAARSDGVKGRIVNSSSGAHVLGKLDFNTLKDSPERRKSDPQSLYAQSKYVSRSIIFRICVNDIINQGNVVLALELARRYGDQGIISSALNPGRPLVSTYNQWC